MKFVICGLPRTGTTILARLIGGLPDTHVLHEPYQRAVKFCQQFPPETFFIHQSCALHFGFKEPFWGIDQGCAFRNDAVLRAHRKCGWRFLYIHRDPLETWASTKRWDITIEQFIENSKRFRDFASGELSVDYDMLTVFGLREVVRVAPWAIDPTLGDRLAASPAVPRLGDQRAFESEKLEPVRHDTTNVTDDERELIECNL